MSLTEQLVVLALCTAGAMATIIAIMTFLIRSGNGKSVKQSLVEVFTKARTGLLIVLGIILLIAIAIGFRIVTDWNETGPWTAQRVSVTITETRNVIQTKDGFVLVGKTFLRNQTDKPSTLFQCNEFPDREFIVPGTHNWKAGTRIMLRLYIQRGSIKEYDFLGVVDEIR